MAKFERRQKSSTGSYVVGLLPALIVFLSAIVGPPVPAATTEILPAEEVVEKRSDLKALRDEIDILHQELSATADTRRGALAHLRDSERSVSAAQRELHALSGRIATIKTALDELSEQSQALQKNLRAQQAQLEKILHRQYLRGKPDPLCLFLNGDDANQLARDLYYLETIGRSRGRLLQSITASLQQQQRLADASRQKAAQLASLEATQREKLTRLEVQHQERQAALVKISGQLASQRQAIGNLQRDEKRLSNLIERLAKIITAQATAAREAARRQEQQRLKEQQAAQRRQALPQDTQQTEKPTSDKAPPPKNVALVTPPPPAPPPEKPAAVNSTTAAGDLQRLKGSLHTPVRGTPANRFGAARQEGGLWRGLFIRAGNGTEVRSIAGGRVVFADWMRGFGNLLIVDHGGSYLSVYANNEALLKQVGEEVRGGEAVATVGNSGGNPESGLYFELRRQGKPLDPSAWLPLK